MLREIDAAGFPVTLHNHLDVVLHDLRSLAPLYLPRTAAALAPAMLLAEALALIPPMQARRWPGVALYVACGAIAMALMHLLTRVHDPVHTVGAAFAPGGLLLQGLAGGFGAYLFFVATGQAHR